MKLLLLTFLTINNNYSDYLYTVMYNAMLIQKRDQGNSQSSSRGVGGGGDRESLIRAILGVKTSDWKENI